MLARAHQGLIWARQRHVNALRRAAARRALVQAGRRPHLQARVVAVHDALTAPQLATPEPVEGAYRQVVDALVGTLRC